jgi:exonuclease SbcC
MSYADATLDLSAVTVACLSGANGAGKSALLDAITWALWGASRAASDDDLIRLGEREMWVDLCFMHEQQKYRVRRARQKSASKSGARGVSKGSLELQVWDGMAVEVGRSLKESEEINALESSASAVATKTRNNGWRSLTAGRVSETDDSIRRLLRMNYDTFINSAYLRQGRADEFTTRPRGERKQVLSEILGLSYFDELQERARDKVRQLRAKQEWLESGIAALSEAEMQLAPAEELLGEHVRALEETTKQVQERETQLQDLQSGLHDLRVLEEKIEGGQKQLADLSIDVDSVQIREAELNRRHHDLSALTVRAEKIEEAMKLFQVTKLDVEEHDRKSLVWQTMNTRKLELQTDLARQRSRIELEFEHSGKLEAEAAEKLSKLERETADAERVEDNYRRFKQLAQEEAEMSQRQEAFVRLTQRSGDLQAAVSEARIRLEADCEQKKYSVAELDSILQSRHTLEEQQLNLKLQAEALDRVESEFELVEERGLAIKTDLESTQIKIEELKRRQKENRDKVAELTCHADSSICPLCAAPIVDRAAVIERYKHENQTIDREVSEFRHLMSKMENDRTLLRKEYLQLKQKLETRKELDTQIGQYNERLNAVARAQDTLYKLRAEYELLCRCLDNQDYAQIERESLVAIRAEIIKLEFDPMQFSAIQSQLRSQRHIEMKFHQLKKDLAELKSLANQMPELRARSEELSTRLASESYGIETRTELHNVQNQISELKYNAQNHSDLQARLSSLISSTDEYRELQKASAELPRVDEMLSGCRALLASKRDQIPLLSESLERWRHELEQIPHTQAAIDQLMPLLSGARRRRDEAAQSGAVARSRVTHLRERLVELSEKRSLLDHTRSQADDFAFLVEAFGKKGIQAVIIENAIPEMEAEANRLLSRLSENKMHVAFVTQQRTKSGGITETLDLLIGDEIGTRAYELYSGGEAFKVNFAIRVALSRLLARRSGAKLETLIIDEGFGSQDDASRERLVRAIRSIQSDFARILVITHFPDVREMFPVQIQVSKRLGTSQLSILS